MATMTNRSGNCGQGTNGLERNQRRGAAPGSPLKKTFSRSSRGDEARSFLGKRAFSRASSRRLLLSKRAVARLASAAGVAGRGRPAARMLWLAGWLWCTCPGGLAAAAAVVPAGPAVIEDCRYSNDAEARLAWRPMTGTSQVSMVALAGRQALRMPCNFVGTTSERASWDRKVTLDLSASRGLEFKVFCREASPVSYFSIYLQSGGGWYQATFFPESSNEWNTITLDKGAFGVEGTPAGWGQVRTIRVSAWRGQERETEFFLTDLRTTGTLGRAQAVQASLDRIGVFGPAKDFEEAARLLEPLAGKNPRAGEALATARAAREAARELLAQGRFEPALDQAALAQRRMTEAWCLAQSPLAGEFRAFWCHSAFGVPGWTWDEAIGCLATNGFNAILPNMLWGGVAYYESKVLPVAPEAAKRGDQIAQCLKAAHQRGVQVHVWKVNWNLAHNAPPAFVEKLRRAGRLQASARGQEDPWLCPSHPDNQKLEIDSMLEVARNYAVDGLHFDYIRYPDADHCFCAGCRERFQKAARLNLTDWPREVQAGGGRRQEWLDWRRGNITTVVRAVSEQAHALRPGLKISAAVFRNWPTDRDGVGQDWKLWCERGWLDFVCPMDYTASPRQFENMVSRQVVWAGATPCYPGIGESASSSRLGVDGVIEQILITRRHGTGGFVVFNYGGAEARELLPMLGLGITARP
jgi:uncharacterized lipoprotein YddW (UPF0748 family)